MIYITPKGSKIESSNEGDTVKTLSDAIFVLSEELKWLKEIETNEKVMDGKV
jgi:hypothetical protein